MLSKALIAALAIPLIGAASVSPAPNAAPARAQDLERLLPSPQWVVEHRDELGIPDAELMPLRNGLKETRRSLTEKRLKLRDLRADMRLALSADPIDRAEVERLFEATLDLENRMKRAQLAARLDFMTHISDEQRQRVRKMSERAPIQRRTLRRRIEEIRTLGRRLRSRGVEARDLRDRLPRIERLIRAGRLREALIDSGTLRDDLNKALRPEGERDE